MNRVNYMQTIVNLDNYPNLNNYVNKIKTMKENNPNLTDKLLIRYVYLDLANYFSFNMMFIAFCNKDMQRAIYRSGNSLFELDKCFETKKITCNSLSGILEVILKQFGINIEKVYRANNMREALKKCSHVYNIIIPDEPEEPYIVDL